MLGILPSTVSISRPWTVSSINWDWRIRRKTMRNNPPEPEPVYWWLSFFYKVKVGNVAHLRGVAIICATSLEAAIIRAKQLEIYPEGRPVTVKGFQIPPEHVPDEKYHNFLLSKLQVVHMQPQDDY
jgi:hypothetical protein